MSIEFVRDILERLETSGIIAEVEWEGVDDELEAMGFCHEDDPDCMEEGDDD
jgi:hypothetical protein